MAKTKLGDDFYQKFDYIIGSKFAKSNLESMIEFFESRIKVQKVKKQKLKNE